MAGGHLVDSAVAPVQIERRDQGVAGLRGGSAERDQVFLDARIQRLRIGPVDLDQIAGRVAHVHLHRSVGQLVHLREERAFVVELALTRGPVHGREVVDVQRDVVKPRRLDARADDDVQLLRAQTQPLYGEGKVRRRDAPHPEQVLVERHGRVEVVRVNTYVVDRCRCHVPTVACGVIYCKDVKSRNAIGNSYSSQGPGLNLRQLHFFLAVADEGSFTRAAERLFVAQPSLSQQIKSLEQELGGPLLERLPKGVRLTAAGKAFVTEARGAVTHAASARRSARSVFGLESGELEVATVTSVAFGVLPSAFRTWHERYPGTTIALRQY